MVSMAGGKIIIRVEAQRAPTNEMNKSRRGMPTPRATGIHKHASRTVFCSSGIKFPIIILRTVSERTLGTWGIEPELAAWKLYAISVPC